MGCKMWQGQGSGGREPERVQSFLRSFLHPIPAVVDDVLTTLLVVGAVWLAALILPQLATLPLDTGAVHADVVARENGTFCEKWGIAPDSRSHALCAHDLDRIRAAEQIRLLQRIGANN